MFPMLVTKKSVSRMFSHVNMLVNLNLRIRKHCLETEVCTALRTEVEPKMVF